MLSAILVIRPAARHSPFKGSKTNCLLRKHNKHGVQ